MQTKYDDKDFDYTFKYHDWETEDFIKEIKYLEWLVTEERRTSAEMEEEIQELNDLCDNLEDIKHTNILLNKELEQSKAWNEKLEGYLDYLEDNWREEDCFQEEDEDYDD